MYSVFFLLTAMTLILIGLSPFKPQSFVRSVFLAGLICLICGNSVSALPQLAAMGAADSALDQRQRVFDESLKLDPTKLRYRGLEYVQFQADSERLSDTQIKSTIKSEINSDIFVAVASGSVQIYGDVQDIDVARDVVTQIKTIPGVREILFDLGLETKAE